MPSQIIRIKPIGNIDRRNLFTQGNMTGVLSRENFWVTGTDNDSMKNQKLPGANRFNATAVGTTFQSGIRYYTKNNVRRTFAYNTDGYIYYFDENGNTTKLIGVFSTLAIPSWTIMRVSGNDILYFSEGINTKMYSYDGNLDNTFSLESAVTLNLVDTVSWLDRLWGSEEDSEYTNYSKNLVPTNFTDATDAGTIGIGAKRGSKIQRHIVLNDILYIFKTDSIWRIIGRTPSEFRVEIVHDSLGLGARWGLALVENGIIFLGSDYEVYSFGGTKDSTKMLTYNAALFGDLTKNLSPIINEVKMDNVRATYHNKIFRMAFTEAGLVTNNMEYLFNTINQTDSFSRNFNISCYIPFDRVPDKQELLVGRANDGRLMKMYQGFNVDNGAVAPTMGFKIQTKFIGDGLPRNKRIRKIWLNSGVLGAANVKVNLLLDGRTSASSGVSDEFATIGETKKMVAVGSVQNAITARLVPKWAGSKGQNFSLLIDEQGNNRDFEFESFDVQIITKELKRSQKVAV